MSHPPGHIPGLHIPGTTVPYSAVEAERRRQLDEQHRHDEEHLLLLRPW